MPDAPKPPMPTDGSAVVQAGAPLAPLGKRIGARLCDFVLVNVVASYVVIVNIAGEDAVNPATAEDVETAKMVTALSMVLAIQFVWEAIGTRLIGGTPMKRVFGLAVVRAGDRGAVGWTQAIVRWGTWGIWVVVPIVGVLAPIVLVIVSTVFVFTRPSREAVWDLVAKTLVVERPR